MKHGHKSLGGALVVAALTAALGLIVAGSQSARAQAGGIIYVDADATGFNNGGSWRNAYTDLQDALDEAEPLDQIWVAAGTYRPTRRFIDDDPRSATFQMVSGVAIYGGFEPDEGITKFEDRDWVAHVTILSGNIGDEDNPDDNSYHVFYHLEDLALDGSAILDGFAITAGNADLVEYPGGVCGGGMYNESSSPTLSNVTFKNNSAVDGGGLFITGGELDGEGSELTLTNVTFLDNSAVDGGAVYIDAAQAMPGETGGITYTNCIFWDNVAERGGGVFITDGELDADTPPFRLTNCTFSGNRAEAGGGIYVGKALGPGEGWLELTNSILWGDSPDEIYAEDPEHPPIVTYSDIQGGYWGDTNIDADPWFVDPDGGDLHLQPGSVCIDSANNGPELAQYDFEGDLRILDGDGDGWAVVDMGADEFKMPTILVEIDITPSIPNNVIKLRSGAVVDVAILSTGEFDAVAQVAPDMVLFAGASHVGFTFVDVDKDGHDDVLLDFRAQDMVDLDEDSSEATLTGVTLDGVPFEGTDEVKVIP